MQLPHNLEMRVYLLIHCSNIPPHILNSKISIVDIIKNDVVENENRIF